MDFVLIAGTIAKWQYWIEDDVDGVMFDTNIDTQDGVSADDARASRTRVFRSKPDQTA